MRWNWLIAVRCAVAAVASVAGVAADAAVYMDRETGFTFSQYMARYTTNNNVGIAFGVATPSGVTTRQSYDAVIQIIAPVDVGWTALAWGGRMTGCPLTVAWMNGNNVVISSRFATGHTQPNAYTGATYTVLKSGTHVNRTHWQVTAKCTGCTLFTQSGFNVFLNPRGSNSVAYAYARGRPANPASNTSTFPYHDVHAYWNHDFTVGNNQNFDTLVSTNMKS